MKSFVQNFMKINIKLNKMFLESTLLIYTVVEWYDIKVI